MYTEGSDRRSWLVAGLRPGPCHLLGESLIKHTPDAFVPYWLSRLVPSPAPQSAVVYLRAIGVHVQTTVTLHTASVYGYTFLLAVCTAQLEMRLQRGTQLLGV